MIIWLVVGVDSVNETGLIAGLAKGALGDLKNRNCDGIQILRDA